MEITKTTNDPSTQLHCIRTTLHISHHSVYHQVYTDLKFTDKCNTYYNITPCWVPKDKINVTIKL